MNRRSFLTGCAALAMGPGAVVAQTNARRPLAFPKPVDCLGGKVPVRVTRAQIDLQPPRWQGEPAKSRRLKTMPDGSIGIFGDSIPQVMHENRMHKAAVNFAMDGLKLRQLIYTLPGYSFMRSAGAGFILCGVNDLSDTELYGPRSNGRAVDAVLHLYEHHLAPYLTGNWVIGHLLPCDEGHVGQQAAGYNAQVKAVNAGMTKAFAKCKARLEFIAVNPAWVDADGNLRDEFHEDGQHPAKPFCRVYEDEARERLRRLTA